MTTTQIKRWGNSLAVRIPKSLLAQVDLKENESVEIKVDDGHLMLSPVKKSKYSLEELMEQITPDRLHAEVDFGKPLGDEVW